MASLTGYDRASAIGWRLLIAAVATIVASQVAASGHPVTALVLILGALLAVSDIMTAGVRADIRADTPPVDLRNARELDRMRALLDAVSTALFAIDANGRVTFANRAGRRLADGEVARLDDIAVLGSATIAAVLAMPPGARRIVRTADSRNLLVWSGSFAVPGDRPQRLLSLQWVAGELDAVEIEAWHAMTRVLTHEMMNSLTPIISLAESVATLPGQDGAAAPALATIARRGTYLMRFIERYRALGDLPPPMPVTLDLAMLLKDIAHAMQPGLTGAGIHLMLRIDGGAATVTADPDLIERAISNLLRNAAEALHGVERPRIDVSLAKTRDGALIAIRDNGPGIAQDRLDEIFVPFFSTRSGGSGIGLPLARQIASLHGGSLIAKPSGVGACFEFYLPDTDLRG